MKRRVCVGLFPLYRYPIQKNRFTQCGLYGYLNGQSIKHFQDRLPEIVLSVAVAKNAHPTALQKNELRLKSVFVLLYYFTIWIFIERFFINRLLCSL